MAGKRPPPHRWGPLRRCPGAAGRPRSVLDMSAGGRVRDRRPVRRVVADESAPVDAREWPASIPAVAQVLREGLELAAGVTLLVGENGSGKSTLVESVAMAFGLAAEGGTATCRRGPVRQSRRCTGGSAWSERRVRPDGGSSDEPRPCTATSPDRSPSESSVIPGDVARPRRLGGAGALRDPFPAVGGATWGPNPRDRAVGDPRAAWEDLRAASSTGSATWRHPQIPAARRRHRLIRAGDTSPLSSRPSWARSGRTDRN